MVKTGRFDEELAVHTMMLGMVNERLLDVTCEDNVVAGIFYTPHPEIDLTCGLARVDWLSNQIGQQRKKTSLYGWGFAFSEQEKKKADEKVTSKGTGRDWMRASGT